jgi:hypothetical protein
MFFHERHANFVAHFPCGFVGTETHIAHDLQCAHAFFAGEHEMGNPKPVSKRLVGVLEDGPDEKREPIPSRPPRSALCALPMPLAGGQIIDGGIAAAGATGAFRPAASLQVDPASILIREHVLELLDGELVDRLGAIGQWKPPDDGRILPWIMGYVKCGIIALDFTLTHVQ